MLSFLENGSQCNDRCAQTLHCSTGNDEQKYDCDSFVAICIQPVTFKVALRKRVGLFVCLVLLPGSQLVNPPEQQHALWSTSFAAHQQHDFARNCVLPQHPPLSLGLGTLARLTIPIQIRTPCAGFSLLHLRWAENRLHFRSHLWCSLVDGQKRPPPALLGKRTFLYQQHFQ